MKTSKHLLSLLLLPLAFTLFSCNKFKSGYSGRVETQKGIALQGVTVYAIRDGKADSNLVHSLSTDEIALFKGRRDIRAYFDETTDSTGKFSATVELERLSSLQNVYLLFKKSGYKSILINMDEGNHSNFEVKLDTVAAH